jgi:formylglycine-generating enzyme required for sulfatase activity
VDLAQQQLPAVPPAVGASRVGIRRLQTPRRVVTAAVLALPACAAAACGARAGPAGRVLLKVDVPAWLEVDGRPAGELSPGTPRLVSLPPGRRRLALLSRGGELRWELDVEVKPAQAVRVVELGRDVEVVHRDYARVPAGRFEMGCVASDPQCAPDESPRHGVTIGRDFWLMRTEVTVAAYAAAAERAGRPLPPPPSFNPGWKWRHYPIVNVTWAEADDHCERVGGRLPTEAEWEYAARGGRAGTRYAWGDDVRPVLAGYRQANVADQRARGTFECREGPCFDGYDDGYSRTSPAFQYSPNGFGLFDLAGNVWEWCADAYGEDYYASSAGRDPPGPDGGVTRVLRGGSWSTGTAGLRLSNRFARTPAEAGDDIGFRCARDVVVPSGAPDASLPVASAARPSGGIHVVVDVPASLHVDGRPVGEASPGEAVALALEQGEHLVAAASQGGEARAERVAAAGPAPSELVLALQPVVDSVRRDFVRVPAGTFEMGCAPGDSECEGNETPRHTVSIGRDFWMMKTEATVADYRAYAASAGQAMPPESDTNPGWLLDTHPMVNLSWEDAARYCEAKGGRLPTEAEWEYAARGGQPARRYVWGNARLPLAGGRQQANVGDERAKSKVGCPQCGWFDGYDDGYVYTSPVGSFAANGFGLFDMAGNAIEWCADWYRERYYDDSPSRDPKGSEFGRWRVLRGGSWSMGPKGLRTSARGGFPPDRTTDNYGVRCVRDVATP